MYLVFIYTLSEHSTRKLKIYSSAATEAADIFHVLFSSEQLVRRMFKLSFKLNSPKLHSADIVLSRAKKSRQACGAALWGNGAADIQKLLSLKVWATIGWECFTPTTQEPFASNPAKTKDTPSN